MTRTIGTCSVCGGRVTVPDMWGGVVPPSPTCEQCGAVAASHGPVIPMRPASPPASCQTFAASTYIPDPGEGLDG